MHLCIIIKCVKFTHKKGQSIKSYVNFTHITIGQKQVRVKEVSMGLWRIVFDNGWEIRYRGDYCGAVNCADGYSIARGCGYTIEEEKE